MQTVRHALMVACLLVVATACAQPRPPTASATRSPAVPSQTPATPTASATPTPGAAKPPVEAAALTELYREPLAAMGLVLTARGGLIDRSEGGYERSPDGDHLALYLEPSRDRSMEEYVNGIVEATKVFVPDVFERWPGLASMDVCQEPLGEEQRLTDPPPVSQVEVSRAQAEAIDWEAVTVADIVAGAEADPPRLGLIVSDELRHSEEYVRATSE